LSRGDGPLRAKINRLNARQSTGPRTAEGRARSSKNSLRHGLTVPIDVMPELSKRRDIIADAIEASGEFPKDLAMSLAGFLITLERVRAARHASLTCGAPATASLSSPIGEHLSTLRYEREARAQLRRVLRQNSRL
jgi:hypothetical protein